MKISKELLGQTDAFAERHLGPSDDDCVAMLKTLGYGSIEKLIDEAVPAQIRAKKPLELGKPKGESEALRELKQIAAQNEVFRSYIGAGYSNTLVPTVIQRNVLENPGWYTQYTPYQAEISQGRLEALLNFQTMVMDMTALPIANASLLDEATAAAEAMTLCMGVKGKEGVRAFFVSETCNPQTIQVVRTRAEPLGIEVIVGDPAKLDFKMPIFGALVQYPDTFGTVNDYRAFGEKVHASGALFVMACDLLGLALMTPPGELGADVAVGSAQRFGVPFGFGGPHAAYMATKDEHKRQIPGRIVGVSQDVDGKPATRLALQTREQHIRREKATSNICTSQVLLAIMASMYAVYHGPKGVRRIAERVHALTVALQEGLKKLGYDTGSQPYFDTLRVRLGKTKLEDLVAAAKAKKINFRVIDPSTVGVSLDEAVTMDDFRDILSVFALGKDTFSIDELVRGQESPIPSVLLRKSAYLTHAVFNQHHSETEMLRYIRKLESRDLSLTSSMIPLGSCTMKLNATTEMLPVSWPEFSAIHPFAPADQTRGYQTLFKQLESQLSEITGFAGTSLQPNAGSQGEYAGLLVIRAYHKSRGEAHRNVCLIPKSAHGTNPATAALAGMRVVVTECDVNGNVDLGDLKAKAEQYKNELAALMVTYPSTHGVFEEGIREICEIVHKSGGQVYMDGANMNAQIGLCRPGDFGPDVCHLNLHKTFCIPHGGGGPGMGPICVAKHLVPFLPTHPVVATGGEKGIGAVSAAPWGSPSILVIPWTYIQMMGAEGLTKATKVAILNANYIAKRLDSHYPVLYKGKNGLVAHECIVDLRKMKDTAGIEVEDVAKRLMDYGFHAPTISFPVPGTMMIEPTESESKEELDRFCEAMILIREEIREIEQGKADRLNNVVKNAPHTAAQVTRVDWTRPYSRERAAFPAPWVRQSKFWPSVGRINNVLGDRNLVCACPPIDAYQ